LQKQSLGAIEALQVCLVVLLHGVKAFYVAEQFVEQARVLEQHPQLFRGGNIFQNAPLIEKPGIAEDCAAEHDAVRSADACLAACVGEVHRIAVADHADRRAKPVPNVHGLCNGVPARRHPRHFLTGAGVDGNGGGLGIEERRQPVVQFVAVIPETNFCGHGQPAGAAFSRPDHCLRQAGLLAQGSAGAAFFHAAVRTPHIDVDTVEAQVDRQGRCPQHGFRPGAEQLRHNGTLIFRIGKAAQQAFPAGRAQAIGGDKLGPHGVRLAVPGNEAPEGGIGHAGERRQNEKRFRQGVPERRHEAGNSGKTGWWIAGRRSVAGLRLYRPATHSMISRDVDLMELTAEK